jgi:hypothetical protein
MSAHPDVEELEAIAMGAGSAEATRHAEGCAECAREVSWLRAEKALIGRRPAPPVQQLWSGIEARISKPRVHRPHWARRIAAGAIGVAAAAAVVIFAMRPRPAQVVPGPSASSSEKRDDWKPDPKALAALDRAETDYRDAAKVLEAEYDRLRPRLDPAVAKKWDETLVRARTQLGEVRTVAAEDVNARMQVLDGYAGYLRSLKNVVQQSEEANP